MSTRFSFFAALLIAGLGAGNVAAVEAQLVPQELKDRYRRPLLIPFPEREPYSLQKATLGKMLYFDPRLSGAQNMNCASCHNPSFGWEVPVDGAVGAANTKLARNAPTILNVAWVKPFFWDGRAPDLESQAAGPLTAGVEMNGKFEEVTARLSAVPEYRRWFERVFPGEGVSRETILRAIATYERTVVSGWTPFDRWIEGDEGAISEAAIRGFALFNGKARCADCHSGWNFTDNKFHDIGLATDDEGRAEFAPGDPKAVHAFKTPGLRDTLRRAPFMHNGSLTDMEQVLYHYVSGGVERPSRSDKMGPLELSEREIGDLLSFLETLTAAPSEVATPILPVE